MYFTESKQESKPTYNQSNQIENHTVVFLDRKLYIIGEFLNHHRTTFWLSNVSHVLLEHNLSFRYRKVSCPLY